LSKKDLPEPTSPRKESDTTTKRYCDGITRRDCIKAGVRGAACLTLAQYLRLAHADDLKDAKAKSAVFIFLGGGPMRSTSVFVTREFGRTPKINKRADRDHWPRAFFTLLAGGGMKGGQVIGASDDKGMGPAGEPITPDQVAASFYHSLGIDHLKEYHTSTGRPVMIVREGAVIPGLFG
jgi:hypothetical protein